MKRLFLCLAFVLMASACSIAQELIPLSVSKEENIPIGNHIPKSPMEPPTVYIEDFTLSFETGHPDYVLNIKDEDGDTVYTTVVYSAQTQTVLPSTLSGEYELRLIPFSATYYYRGYVSL